MSFYDYDYESERCILAAMLDSEDSLIETVSTMTAEDFYEPRHAAMFDILTSLYTRSIKPTYLELLKEGTKSGMLAKPEDREYAKQTVGYHVSSTQLPYWLKIVKDKSRLRKLRKALRHLSDEMQKPTAEVDDLLRFAEKSIVGLCVDDVETIETGKELAEYGKQIIVERMNRRGELQGINTGIGKLNRLTGGWKPGDLVIVAAESGKGKTAFSQNWIAKACFARSVPTLYINSEMSRSQVILRFASMVADVDNELIKFGEITEMQKQAIFDSMTMIETAPFYHYPSPALNLPKVISAIRKMYIQKGVKLVVLDYIGRLDRVGKDSAEWEEIYAITKALKTLAQELQICIMILAQLKDDGSLQAAKRMRNEADIMLKLQPMTQSQMDEAAQKDYKVKPNYFVLVDKNRDGQGDVLIPVLFNAARMQVIDVANL